jgi:2-oxoglutarate ferredoxin oxidoreductase subunit gamma
MSQQALEKYSGDIDPERVAVLVDSTLVEEVPGSLERVYQLPATELAEETLGRRLVANMLMLGAVSKLADFVTAESLGKAVETQVPPNTVELNLKALEAGRRGLARLL